jgi:flavorubredoxin
MENPEHGPGKAVVLYASVFGNTERIAKALAKGIQQYCEVDCIDIRDADPARLSQYSLVAVGAPTQAFSAYAPMKEFLSRLEGGKNLKGRYGFAFDTKLDSRLSGSAAKYIEKRLEALNLEIVKPRSSAIVSGGTKDNVLKEGEEVRFEAIGGEIGALLARHTIALTS